VSGNPRALARLFVIAVLIGTGLVLALVLRAPPHVMVGSFLGAALSLAVGGLVMVLEDEEHDNVPAGFLAAAKKDVINTHYYRDHQVIRISVDAEDDAEVVELRFSADIVPINGQAKIEHPLIEPPAGVTLVECTYRVGGAPVPKDQATIVNGRSGDELILKYKIQSDKPSAIEDDHLWPSPVLSYSVEFGSSGGNHTFEVSKIIAGSKCEALRPLKARRSKVLEFAGEGAAFTTQGLRWRIARSTIA
jgi:hypothetical protein